MTGRREIAGKFFLPKVKKVVDKPAKSVLYYIQMREGNTVGPTAEVQFFKLYRRRCTLTLM